MADPRRQTETSFERDIALRSCVFIQRRLDMRPILLCLLALATVPAHAEWLKVAENDQLSLYLDSTSLLRNGQRRKVWEIENFKEPQKNGERSRRTRQEYDCNKERSRSVLFYEHNEPTRADGELPKAGFKSRAIRLGICPATHAARVCPEVRLCPVSAQTRSPPKRVSLVVPARQRKGPQVPLPAC